MSTDIRGHEAPHVIIIVTVIIIRQRRREPNTVACHNAVFDAFVFCLFFRFFLLLLLLLLVLFPGLFSVLL